MENLGAPISHINIASFVLLEEKRRAIREKRIGLMHAHLNRLTKLRGNLTWASSVRSLAPISQQIKHGSYSRENWALIGGKIGEENHSWPLLVSLGRKALPSVSYRGTNRVYSI
jgi:hypothetical protein